MRIVVESSQSLTSTQKSDLTAKLVDHYGSDLELDFQVDSKLIGGIRLTTDTTTVDLSVKAKLAQLQAVLN